jgi:hypothetical protein
VSGNQWSDDSYESDEDDFTPNSEGIGQLRKAYRAVQKEKKEMETELVKLRRQTRSVSVGEILAAQNVNPKVAHLVPADVEPTKEGITAWLEEYGDVFNVKGSASEQDGGPATEEKQAEPAYTSDDVAALRKVASGTQGGTVDATRQEELLRQVQTAATQEDFLKLMAQHGVGSNTAGG